MARDTRIQLVFAAKNLADQALGRLNRGLHGLRRTALSLKGPLLALGGALRTIGTLALTTGIAAIAAGLAGIGASAKNAADEQAGLARLNAALKANVANRKGATAAIEKQAQAGMALGFTDDSVRESFARLLPISKNVALATRANNVAMDLARMKGISLESASDLVAKAMAGNLKALKALGIQLPKNATKQQILAAIQKKAAGQAKAYGETASGSMEAFKVALDDLVGNVGKDFLPIVAEAFTWLRKEALPVVEKIIAGVKEWVSKNQPLIDQVSGFVSGALRRFADFVANTVIPALVGRGNGDSGLVGAVMKIAKSISENVIPKVEAFITALTSPGGVVDSIGKVVGPIVQNLIPAFGKIVESLFGSASSGPASGPNAGNGGSGGLVGALGRLVAALWGDGTGPLPTAIRAIGALFTDVLLPAVDAVIGAFTTLVDLIAEAVRRMDEWAKKKETVIPIVQMAADNPKDFWANFGAAMAGSMALGGHAKGGWVGLNGPEIGLLGEKGPEYVLPNDVIRGLLRSGSTPSAPGLALRSSSSGSSRSPSSGGPIPHSHPIYLDGKKVGDLLDQADYYGRLGITPSGNRT